MTNPFAGSYVEDLGPLVELGAELGQALIDKALAALGCPAADVSAYGEAAVFNVDEHAVAADRPEHGASISTVRRCGRSRPRRRAPAGPGHRRRCP